jgi:hypothetical protein
LASGLRYGLAACAAHECPRHHPLRSGRCPGWAFVGPGLAHLVTVAARPGLLGKRKARKSSGAVG